MSDFYTAICDVLFISIVIVFFLNHIAYGEVWYLHDFTGNHNMFSKTDDNWVELFKHLRHGEFQTLGVEQI